MRKTILILAAIAAVICRAEPDDMATEAYAHFEATNEVEKAKAQIATSINAKSAQDRAYASSVASNALTSAKSYADSLVVSVDSDGIISNAVETAILIVDGRGYLLPSATNGLAKASYVDAKVMEQIDLWKAELGTTNYAQKSWVLSLDYTTLGAVQSYLASMDYASKGHVSDNYVSKAQLNAADYASKTWVDSYVGEHVAGAGSLAPATNYTDSVAQSIRTNAMMRSFVRDNGDVYYWITNGIWSTDRDDYINGARLYLWAETFDLPYQTNWTWYIRGGTSSGYRTIQAPVDAAVLRFQYSPGVTNTFIRGGTMMYAEDVGAMIANKTSGMSSGGVDAQTVTNIVRSANGGLWDAGLEVWWTPVVTNGCLIYKATTNVNMNAEATP